MNTTRLVQGIAILVMMIGISLCSEGEKPIEVVVSQESASTAVEDIDAAESRNKFAPREMNEDPHGIKAKLEMMRSNNRQQENKDPSYTNRDDSYDSKTRSYERPQYNKEDSYDSKTRSYERPQYNKEDSYDSKTRSYERPQYNKEDSYDSKTRSYERPQYNKEDSYDSKTRSYERPQYNKEDSYDSKTRSYERPQYNKEDSYDSKTRSYERPQYNKEDSYDSKTRSYERPQYNKEDSYDSKTRSYERPGYNQEANNDRESGRKYGNNNRPSYSDRRDQNYMSNKEENNRYNQAADDYRASPMNKERRPSTYAGRGNDQYSVNSANEAVQAGEQRGREADETEKRMRAAGLTQLPNAPPDLIPRNLSESSRAAYIALEATRAITKSQNMKSGEVGISLRGTALERSCPIPPTCNDYAAQSPYRTIDGSCNNVNQPAWGQAGSPYRRILPNSYSDGVWEPRVSKSGYELPSPRLISASIAPDIEAPSQTHTLWVMQFGQFITHDIALAPQYRRFDDRLNVLCCANGQHVSDPSLLHPVCLPIDVPKNDEFYSQFGVRCMNFVRTIVAPRADCKLGNAEQTNTNTHYLDHSNVYGSDAETARELRTLKNGQLNSNARRGRYEMQPLLPPDLETSVSCALPKNVSGEEPSRDVKCFSAGDSRVNQHPDLMVTHTIFLRQHNRLAEKLADLNPGWDDERLYQEARRIMTAQMQHITYKEWLPMIIGRETVGKLGLQTLDYGFSKDYDQSMDPSIGNEFSVAAFRFHSQVQGTIDLVNEKRKRESSILLREHFTRTQVVYTPGNLEKFLIGLATQPMQQFDNYFTEDLTNHLFAQPGRGFGNDLVSININRGRDHGAQGYNAYRAMCGLPRAKNFQDLQDVIPSSIVKKFEQLYETVDDIDLFIAGVSEKPVSGGITGPTFQCMVADQFMRLKRGDRFFYDLSGQPGSFTEEQLNEIRTTTLARIICDNSDVKTIQPSAFQTETDKNPIVDCDSKEIPWMDLSPWRDSSYNREEMNAKKPNNKNRRYKRS